MRTITHALTLAVIATGTLFKPLAANAEQSLMSKVPTSPFYLSESQPGWHFDVFLGYGIEPTYAGSDDTESELDGNARAFYTTDSGHRYYLSLGEIGGYWSLGDDSQFVAFFEYEEGREASEDPTLEGLDEIDSTLEGQFFYVQRWGNTYGSLALQPDLLGRGKGLVWFAGIGHDWFINEDFRVTMTADISGANSTYMKTEFGISKDESARTGLDAYSPSSGLKSFSTVLEAEYFFDENWSLLSSVEWEKYLDVTIDSPLIRDEGSENNITTNVLVRYRF